MSKQTNREEQAVLDKLAELGGRLTAEEDVLFQGTKLVIPERMTLRDAKRFIAEKIDEDERAVSFTRLYKYRPWDGARAVLHAFRKAFGMVTQRATYGIFGRENPPQLITIDTGVEQTEAVPWGAMAIPMLPGATFYLDGDEDPELGVIFQLTVQGPRKYRFEIEGLFRLVEVELETNSLYRGKAFDGQDNPKFLDLRGFDESKVIYSEEVLTQLDANVWSVLRYSDELRELGLPLKRAVLLEGPYGTGKTLAASWTARVALENGWTFISCRPGRDDFLQVMQTARLYQPAVVFFEDVDSITDPESAERDRVSQLLDVFDGIQAKDTRIVVVLTTNHVERIHKGMVRPGRLDAVIPVGALDALGFERLVKAVVPRERLGDVDYEKVAIAFDGFMPAFAREAIDRTVRYNVARNKGKATELHTADFVHSAEGLRYQLELMEGAKETGTRFGLDEKLKALVGEKMDGAAIVRGGQVFGELKTTK